ncbi:MAG: hypothetical protein RLZZ443_918 [Actinomycetota bacterium]|jgi:uncharacterized protein YdhG (YjbR/CyaY superfamily)
MSEADVTAYIDAQPEPKRSTLHTVRERILAIEPGLEQVIAWNSPQFKFNGKYAVGLCAFKNHLTFSPQSPDVLTAHAKDLEGFVVSKSSFQFGVDEPLSSELLTKLVKARLAELA